MKKVINYLLHGGINNNDEYNIVRPLLWKRNVRAIQITTLLASLMGGVFLIFNLIKKSGVYIPYIFLLIGSVLTFILLFFFHSNR